jgi:AraC family transcriptional regulator
MNQVIDHMDRHYGSAIALEELARVSGFSLYHFHRLFTAILGEPVYSYLNRRRLERAAQFLRHHPERAVTHIALSCGFTTPANFARAFKVHFGTSASRYRKGEDSKISQVDSKQGIASVPGNVQASSMGMNVEMTTLPSYHVAYLRHFGGYASPDLAQTWVKLIRWASSRGKMTADAMLIGVPHDDDTVTPHDKCRYDACIVVGKDESRSDSVNYAELPGGTFATFSTRKPPSEVGRGWEELYSRWLPDSGFIPDWGPGLEFYGEPAIGSDGCFALKYAVPVRPL